MAATMRRGPYALGSSGLGARLRCAIRSLLLGCLAAAAAAAAAAAVAATATSTGDAGSTSDVAVAGARAGVANAVHVHGERPRAKRPTSPHATVAAAAAAAFRSCRPPAPLRQCPCYQWCCDDEGPRDTSTTTAAAAAAAAAGHAEKGRPRLRRSGDAPDGGHGSGEHGEHGGLGNPPRRQKTMSWGFTRTPPALRRLAFFVLFVLAHLRPVRPSLP